MSEPLFTYKETGSFSSCTKLGLEFPAENASHFKLPKIKTHSPNRVSQKLKHRHRKKLLSEIMHNDVM